MSTFILHSYLFGLKNAKLGNYDVRAIWWWNFELKVWYTYDGKNHPNDDGWNIFLRGSKNKDWIYEDKAASHQNWTNVASMNVRFEKDQEVEDQSNCKLKNMKVS